jgi:general secretion pathway protein N
MPGRLGWFALGVGAYLAFALATFPAATAYRWFAPPGLLLSGVDGTIWSGRAALASVQGLPLRELRWQLQPAALLRARAAVQFDTRLAEGFVSGEARAGLRRIELLNLRGATAIPVLRSVMPLDGVEGQVSVAITRFELFDGWPVDLSGEISIADLEVVPLMAAADSSLVPLGNYVLQFAETGGEGLLAQVRDAGGPLEVSGVLELGTDRAYRIDGFVRARDSASPDLVQGLQFMTDDPDPTGRRAFSFIGTL